MQTFSQNSLLRIGGEFWLDYMGKQMKNRLKTILAFSILVIVVISAFSLSVLDKAKERYPDSDTRICLYGEKHGIKAYYDIEFFSDALCPEYLLGEESKTERI